MKRLIALLLSFVMMIGLLSACGGGGGGSVSGDLGEAVDPNNFVNTDRYPLEGDHKLTMGVALNNADEAYLMQMMED